MNRSAGLVIFALVLLIAAFVTSPGNSAQKKGKTRPCTTSQMMAGLVKPKYVAVKEALEKGPKTDEEWKAVAIDAALLNESSYLMMADERCPDKIWEEGAGILRTSTAELLALIEKRDAEAAVNSIESITQSCKVCHTEHKYKKPAE